MNLLELKKLAEAATTGPWEVDDPWVVMSRHDGDYVYLANTASLDTLDSQCVKDALFIAAANPATILALIALIEQQHEALQAMEKWASSVHDGYPRTTASIAAEPSRKKAKEALAAYEEMKP